MKLAALIADEFNLDPVTVLKSSYFDWSVRHVAFDLVQEKKRKDAEAQKAAAKASK